MNQPQSSARPTSESAAHRATSGARQRTPGRTLGPVSDLEQHLPPDWWSKLFSATYLATDGDVVENREITARECDQLAEVAGLEPGHRILDVCCGQGRHLLELATRGYGHLTGVDRSRYLVRVARRRAKELGVTVGFHEGDARKLRFAPGSFDRVTLLGNSFGYFDRPEDDLRVFQSIRSVLVPEGLLVLDVADGDWMRENFEPRSWEWIDGDQFVCRERALSSDRSRLIAREVVVHAEKGVLVDQFYAERLYSAADLEDLLVRAGFGEVTVHGPAQVRSERNQDLGMMAHRIVLTARPRPAAPRALARAIEPRVTVLLGDPRLPDAVKREGQFNQEDLQTIAELEEALAELTEYDTTLVDDHSQLLSTFRESPPAFVLNLCDEGYRNDSFMELHVPALLDLLGIPYSGAGPTCLGACYDKALVRAVAQSLDIPVPAETFLRPYDVSARSPSAFPVLVKPNLGDSSQGITEQAVVDDPAALVEAVRRLREQFPSRPILVQEFLQGAEYSVGVVGNPGIGVRTLPILEVDYSALDPARPRILGYESKWHPESPYWNDVRYVEAELDEPSRAALVDHSMVLFERLGCRDYARFDWRADADGEVKLLEVNPNPGWCWDGKLNLMAKMAGWSYADLLGHILRAAQERLLLDGRLGRADVEVAAAEPGG